MQEGRTFLGSKVTPRPLTSFHLLAPLQLHATYVSLPGTSDHTQQISSGSSNGPAGSFPCFRRGATLTAPSILPVHAVTPGNCCLRKGCSEGRWDLWAARVQTVRRHPSHQLELWGGSGTACKSKYLILETEEINQPRLKPMLICHPS